MQNPRFSTFVCLLLLACLGAKAQFITLSANSYTICNGQSIALGGSPTASGGTPPYQYHWSQTTAVSANPVVSPAVTTTYNLTVTDNASHAATASQTVTVFDKYNLQASANLSSICTGQQIELNATRYEGCLTAPDCGVGSAAYVGNGFNSQPGTQFQAPALLGNFKKSSRNQMLYKAAELQAALGGPQLITTISFNLSIFNGNGFLDNFSIKIGCTNKDSLVDWENNLLEVYRPMIPILPQPGWLNYYTLTTPFYWDGISDLVVDVSYYNPVTFGSQGNKAQCTGTAFQSYLFSWGDLNQSTISTTPQVYNLRPNIKFEFCTPTVNPVPVSYVTYNWLPASGLPQVSDATIPSPTAVPPATTTYTLQITDAFGCKAHDSVTVQVTNKYDLQVSASDTVICNGEFIHLTSSSHIGCLSAPNPGLGSHRAVVGTDSIAQTGNALQPPALLGNYQRSGRSQMLYKAAELQAALGGPQLITAISFNMRIFNSNASLFNFSIKMGCTSKDSLMNWENNLVEVFAPVNPISPQSGWGDSFLLSTPIYWDGGSDLIVDVCNYNPSTFGSQENKASCTNTPFKSYLFKGANTDQCGTTAMPLIYNLRPNIRFHYCTPVINPVPLGSSATFSWTPATGPQAVAVVHGLSTTASPDSSATYTLFISDADGCAETGSVSIRVTHPGTASIVGGNAICPGITEANVTMLLNPGSSSHYSLLNAANTDTLYTGNIATSQTILFQHLPTGAYHLQLNDSVCPVTDVPVYVSNYAPVNISPPAVVRNVTCLGASNGQACINASGGNPPYKYLWDSLAYHGACYDSLPPGNHYVTLVDFYNCAQISAPFNITEPLSPLVVSITHDTTITSGYAVSVHITGGIAPYRVTWGTTDETITDSVADYLYLSTDNQTITVTDSNGCVITNTVPIIYNLIKAANGASFLFHLQPNPATDYLNMVMDESMAGSTFSICDVTGKKVLTTVLTRTNNTWSLGHLANGIYFTLLENAGGRWSRKLVIQK